MAEPTPKRKKPPSFPHVHPSRARKFKKAWVEKAKIASKWKAQKKGLKEKLEIPQYKFEERDDPDNPTSSTSHPSNMAVEEEPSTHFSKTTQHWRGKQTEEPKADEDDVRVLMREAYSKSNLHTFKSDPLKKRAAVGPKGEKGKGQPNMKLRMNALLAKIKRDHP